MGTSRNVWENVECKLKCVNSKRVSNPRRAFRPAFGATGISDDWYRSTMGVIVISLRTPQCARETFGSTWQHLGSPTTRLGVPMISVGVPTSSLEAPGSTSNYYRAVWENEHLHWERCWFAWKWLLLLIVQRFLQLMYSVCILIYVSI